MESLGATVFGQALQQLLDAPIPRALEMLGFTLQQPLNIPEEIFSVQALLAHPAPPLELLDAVFLAAQHSRTVTRSVADVLQLAAMSVAMTRCGFQIPDLEQPMYRELYDVAIRLDWIDEATREYLDDGLTALTAASEHAVLSAPAGPVDATAATTAEATAEPTEPPPAAEPSDEASADARPRRPIRTVFATLCVVAAVGFIIYQQATYDDVPPLEGLLESTAGEKIVGWAWDNRRPTEPVDVELSDGVHPPVVVHADAPRPELKFVGANTVNHGFVYVIPPEQRDGKSYPISARIAGTKFTLKGSPQSVTFGK